MYRFAILVVIFSFVGGAVEDDVYVASLASNIEKSGLLKNFKQSWREHLDTWNKNQEPRQSEGAQNYNLTFDCNTTNEDHRQTFSVNRVRPSDIGIVGALGASFVAGIGAGAERLLEVTEQYRGVAFPIGGDGNWSTTPTLPNILKEYNPRLRGWSRSVGPAWFEEMSHLNVAIPGATSKDLEDQAKELVKRLKQMRGAENQWKVISIYIGMNDLCESCEKRTGGKASSYGRRIKNAIDKLHKDLKRTIVNLIALPPMNQWYTQFHDDPVCRALHRYLCPCISNREVDRLSAEYNRELYQLPERYDRIDFAVIVQPFMSGRVEFPKKPTDNSGQKTDQSLFAPDCFHFNRKGHAVAAQALWANMFQAVGQKERSLNLDSTDVVCPDENCPYIRTWQNSRRCDFEKLTTTSWPILENISALVGNFSWPPPWLENATIPPWFNRSHRTHAPWFNRSHHTHHQWLQNVTQIPIFNMTPWHHNFMRMMQPMQNEDGSAMTYSTGTVAWMAVGIILSLTVIGAMVGGGVYWNKRRSQTNQHERTPLLASERLY